MFMNLIFNASIILLCVFVYYLALLRMRYKHAAHQGLQRIITGFVFGFAGIFLISHAVLVGESVRLDFRGISILVSAMLGGFPSAMITTVMIAAARIWQGGLHYESMVGVISSFVIAFGCVWIRSRAASRARAFTLALGYSYIIVSAALMLVIRDQDILQTLLMNYALTYLPVAWLCYQLNESLDRIHKLYEELHYREETYRQLFHSAQDIVYLTEIEGVQSKRFLDVNDTACRILGYSREELLGLKPVDIYDDSQLHKIKAIGEEFERSGCSTFEWTLKTRDGQPIQVEISGRIFQLHGETVCLSVVRDISLRKEAERKLLEANRMLEKLSISDGLTGITNRRGFDAFYGVSWDQVSVHARPISVLMFDIDFFKAYNDTYGHAIGDICLKKVAGVLDYWGAKAGGLAARYGGEEFVIVLPGTGIETAAHLAEQIRRAVEDLAVPHSNSAVHEVVTVSIGAAACSPKDGTVTQENLLRAADQALYSAKHNGRNRVSVWKPDGRTEAAWT